MLKTMASLAATALVACSGTITTERSRIHLVLTSARKGHYVKAGGVLDEPQCGEAYRRAVAGVGAAEDLVAECARWNRAAIIAASGFVALPLASFAIGAFVADRTTREVILPASGVGAGLIALAIAALLRSAAYDRWVEATDLYDRSLRE